MNIRLERIQGDPEPQGWKGTKIAEGVAVKYRKLMNYKAAVFLSVLLLYQTY